MVRLKIDPDALRLSASMEQLAGVRVKDCFIDDKEEETIYFVVETGQLGKALGKNIENIKKLQQKFNKKIRVIEYRDNVVDFIKNVIYPLQVEQIILNDDQTVSLKDSNRKTKSLLIGRDGKNLKLINRAVQRFFPVEEIKII